VCLHCTVKSETVTCLCTVHSAEWDCYWCVYSAQCLRNGLKEDKVTGEWRKLHNKDLNYL